MAVASAAITVLNCVHPPDGDSALLPCVDTKIREMGWWYLPAQMTSSVLMVAVACITNNVIRSYIIFWWTVGTIGERAAEPEAKVLSPKASPILSAASELPNIQFFRELNTIEVFERQIAVLEELDLEKLELEWLASLQTTLSRARRNRTTGPAEVVEQFGWFGLVSFVLSGFCEAALSFISAF